mmetsp:Transcript_18402/g.27923  ORF Transcript_18402/g.27923 Transcript_18402/m.27923 type:complete len:338 (+) Transcript_18402:135-1148(+)
MLAICTVFRQQLQHSSLQQRYCAKYYKSKVLSRFRVTSSRPTSLTRKERRRLEREAKKESSKLKQHKNKPKEDNPTKASKQFWSISGLEKLYPKRIPNPRIPGGKKTLFHKSHRFHLISRFSLALALCLLLEWGDISPYHLDMAQGPSMLPTFFPIGDIYIRETGSLHRLLGIPIGYKKGDLVVFRDKDGRYAGKRIIGLAGDHVIRHGQYAHVYASRPDLGILKGTTKNYKDFEDHENGETGNLAQQIVVPPDHVWVEGDFPLFSVDSRQYGPIPMDWIRGRIILRVWPWRSPQVTRNRPMPLTLAEVLSGNYNLHPHPLLSKQHLTDVGNEAKQQ